MRERIYRVYILASRRGGAIYIGVTNNLSARVYAHKQGRGSKHTARYGIDQLVWYETHTDIAAAIQRETSMKRWPRAWKTNLIYAFNPAWRDLYQDLNN